MFIFFDLWLIEFLSNSLFMLADQFFQRQGIYFWSLLFFNRGGFRKMTNGLIFIKFTKCLIKVTMSPISGIDLIDRLDVLSSNLMDDIRTVGLMFLFLIFEEA